MRKSMMGRVNGRKFYLLENFVEYIGRWAISGFL
jgi:hypothetical protein